MLYQSNYNGIKHFCQALESTDQKSDRTSLTKIEHMCYSATVWFLRQDMESELSEIIDGKWNSLPEENGPEIESDLPPEYCHYQDEGCELSDSCLHCPFPQCIDEEPGGRQHWLKKLRNREIAKLFSSGGKEAKELALMFGVSKRTIQRALKSSLLAPSRNINVNKETTG